jgi:hypothetical protein
VTSKREVEVTAHREGEYAKTLPRTFILTEKRQSEKAFAIAATAAKNPVQPLRPGRYLAEDESSSKRASSPSAVGLGASSGLALTAARVPPAKRSHMDGVLCGIPGAGEPVLSTQQRAFGYDDEMQGMNRGKDTQFHRKRDAYSDYVEARARFSKMHSVT